MEKRLPPNLKTLTSAILFIAGVGALTFVALCAPNALQMLKPFLRNSRSDGHFERKRIRQALERLANRRFIEIHQKGNTLILEVTEQGKRRLKELEFENLVLPKVARWDNKWRIVIFDIPENHKRARNAFQYKLKEMGFYPLQKSVFAYPYECRDEIDFATSFCAIRPFVHYLETPDLDAKEGAARRFFHLI